jgi:hypothetical protein
MFSNSREELIAVMYSYYSKSISIRKDSNKTSKLLVKVLRNTASAEPNQQLQSCLFLHAQKCESLEGERDVFNNCDSQCSVQIDQAKTLLIAPLRVSPSSYRMGKPSFTVTSIDNAAFFNFSGGDC